MGAAQGALCRQLAGPSDTRFSDVAWSSTVDGAVLLDDSLAWYECSVDRTVRVGDHDIVLLNVLGHGGEPGSPLIFHGSRFHRVKV